MIHILFLILKIIGWILLILLALILLLVVIVLFCPVKYKISAEGHNSLDSLKAEGKVSWLFRLISGTFRYENENLEWNLRLAWKKMGEPQEETSSQEGMFEQEEKNIQEGNKIRPESDAQPIEPARELPEKPRNQEQKQPEPKKQKEKREILSEEPKMVKSEITPKKEERKQDRPVQEVRKQEVPKESLFEKIKKRFTQIYEKIKYTFQKLCATLKKVNQKRELFVAFFTYDKHQRAFEKAKKEVKRLLHFLKPRKLCADIVFGFSDPSWTGYMLAFLGSMYGTIGEYVQIQPDFEQRRLEGTVSLEGKIRAIYFVIPAWNLFWDKDVKITYKHIRKYIK